jgi:hypothetical protein
MIRAGLLIFLMSTFICTANVRADIPDRSETADPTWDEFTGNPNAADPDAPPVPLPASARPAAPTPHVTFVPVGLDSKFKHCAAEKEYFASSEGDGPTSLDSSIIGKAVAQGVPRADMTRAVAFFNSNSDRIRNRRYITIARFSQDKSENRFYLIDTSTGQVQFEKVSHGKKSDKDHNGKVEPTDFSNENDSNRSSCGLIMTGKSYQSALFKPKTSLHLHGMQPGINDNMCGRQIMAHAKKPAGEKDTLGCLGLPAEKTVEIIEKIKDWSMIYVPCR